MVNTLTVWSELTFEQALFSFPSVQHSRATLVREHESDVKIRPDRGSGQNEWYVCVAGKLPP